MGTSRTGDRLLDEAVALAGQSDVALARVELERGRVRRSSGDAEAALPLFESAFSRALDSGQDFIAADAAHMAALAAPDREGFVRWTKRGIELAEQRDGASYWLGPLLNNLGWEYHDAGELEPALDAFERALRARERDPENAAALEIARYAVGKTLRGLGRANEAVPLLEQAVEWSTREGAPDGWFHEELAEDYAAVGRLRRRPRPGAAGDPTARGCDPSFAEDPQRQARVRSLSPNATARAECSRACASAPALAWRARSRAPR